VTTTWIMYPNSILRRWKWLLLPLLAAGGLVCDVRNLSANSPCQGGGSGDDDDDCPSEFTDGFYNKFRLDLKDAGRTHRWAIFTYGSGTSSSRFTSLDVSAPTTTTQGGAFQITGDVAMAGAYSNLNLSGYGSLSGDRYLQTTSNETRQGTHTVLGGSKFSSNSTNTALNNAVTALKTVSTTAAGLTKTNGSPSSISLNHNNLSFSNNPFAGKYVMNLSSLVMSNNSVLTLTGSAGSAFVINVSGAFSLTSGAKIVLAGGLTTSDVLFNVTGNTGAFTIAGGSLFNGTLLAYNSTKNGTQRTLTVDGAGTLVTGQLIANKVIVSNGAKVRKPPKVSCDRDDDDDDDDNQGGGHGGHGH
jgi:hypothetical protein